MRGLYQTHTDKLRSSSLNTLFIARRVRILNNAHEVSLGNQDDQPNLNCSIKEPWVYFKHVALLLEELVQAKSPPDRMIEVLQTTKAESHFTEFPFQAFIRSGLAMNLFSYIQIVDCTCFTESVLA